MIMQDTKFRFVSQVMIISQWTTVLELCSAYLDENDFKHLMWAYSVLLWLLLMLRFVDLKGNWALPSAMIELLNLWEIRELLYCSVRRFIGSPARVCTDDFAIVSLKAGGVGLNLTAASRVINLDLAWSNAGKLIFELSTWRVPIYLTWYFMFHSRESSIRQSASLGTTEASSYPSIDYC